MDAHLINSDIAPVSLQNRTWNAFSYFSLWVGMVVCIPTYMIAASLINGGMSWAQALLTVLLGNCIVLIPMLLNGHPGAKHGIPFPVLARASFGIRGSNIPALFRALVACGWFGIQCWIGGAALYTILLTFWPGAADVPTLLPDFFGIGLVPFLCFLVFWMANIYLIWKGVESIRIFEVLCTPLLIVAGLVLLVWAYVSAKGFGPMLTTPSQFQSTREFWNFFVPALTGMVGFWATLSLNISDFTRYAKNQKAHLWGQTLGLPLTMVLFAFIGIAVTSATLVVFGETIWDPILLVRKFNSPLMISVFMFAVLIATLTTNIAANVVSPANDFANLMPSKINFKIGGTLTGIFGILMMPWKLLADPSGYIFTWLIGYSALLGPVAGILLVDYFLIRRCRLVVEDLYKKKGRYAYSKGINPKAVFALVCGILPNVPGFLAQVGWMDAGRFPFLSQLYHYAWFTGFGISGIFYYVLSFRPAGDADWLYDAATSDRVSQPEPVAS